MRNGGAPGVDGSISEQVIRTALPEELMTIPEWAFEYNKLIEEDEDYLLGNNAMNNLAKAKVSGADDALVEGNGGGFGPPRQGHLFGL